jgi:hypothetical protein
MGKIEQILTVDDLPPLCSIQQAAQTLGVPRASLRSAAETHGYIVRMGRAVLLESDRLSDLVKKCRDPQKEHVSTNSNIVRAGTSGTQANPTKARAMNAAKTLKKRSRPTSPQKAGQVVPMSRQT